MPRLTAPDCSIPIRPIRSLRNTDAIHSFFWFSFNAGPIGNRAVPDQPPVLSLTTNTPFPHPLSPSFFHLPSIHLYFHITFIHLQQWPEPSRQPVSPLVARPPVSSSPPRLPVRPPLRPVVSRSLTATSLVPSLSVRSVATRSPPSS